MKRIRIHIEDGEVIRSSHSLKEVIGKLKDGEYAVDVKKWSGSKTWKQIKAVKGVLIPEYATYTGLSKKEAERELKLEYGVAEYFMRNSVQHVELVSFSEYSKHQMMNFIDGVLRHLEEDCNFIIDFETRKKLQIDDETGELTKSP